MRKVGLLIAITCLLSFMVLGSHAQGMDSSDSSEYLIKAGFIYNFAKLVEWPTSAFAQQDSPIVIGILGDDPFGGPSTGLSLTRKSMGEALPSNG